MSERLHITDIVLRRHGKFLVVTNRKFPDGYTCPGGKVDREDPSTAHAAARELREEVGVRVAPEDLLYIGFFDYRWRGMELRCFSYEAPEAVWTGQEPCAVEEGTKILWVDRDDLVDVGSSCLSQGFYGWLMGQKNW